MASREKYMVSDLPTGQSGNMFIDRFTVGEDDIPTNLYIAKRNNAPALVNPGVYTRLSEMDHFGHSRLWMVDTPTEIEDHMECITHIESLKHGKILINGLGLGLVLKAAIQAGTVDEITVVEIDMDIIKLVEQHYQRMARKHGVKLHIIHGNAMTQDPIPVYDVVWHDIWQRAEPSNASSMAKLHNIYADHAVWQGSWRQTEVVHQMIEARNHLV